MPVKKTLKQIKRAYRQKQKEGKIKSGLTLNEYKKTKEFKRIVNNEKQAIYRYKRKKKKWDLGAQIKHYDIASRQPYFIALNYGYKNIGEVATKPIKSKKYTDFVPVAMNEFVDTKEMAKKKGKKFAAVINAPDYKVRDLFLSDFLEFQREIKKIYMACYNYQKRDSSRISLVDTETGESNDYRFINIKIYKPGGKYDTNQSEESEEDF